MTFDKFRKEFLMFLESSTVNLGRKTAKTRQDFLDTASEMFKTFGEDRALEASMVAEDAVSEQTKKTASMNDRVLCVKPSSKRKTLDTSKGTHAMTSNESMQADEELNRSPFAGKSNKEGN